MMKLGSLYRFVGKWPERSVRKLSSPDEDITQASDLGYLSDTRSLVQYLGIGDVVMCLDPHESLLPTTHHPVKVLILGSGCLGVLVRHRPDEWESLDI